MTHVVLVAALEGAGLGALDVVLTAGGALGQQQRNPVHGPQRKYVLHTSKQAC